MQTWSDVRTIEVDRCQVVNEQYPCFRAIIEGDQLGSDAVLVSPRLDSRNGHFVAQTESSDAWAASLSALKQADFFGLDVPNIGPQSGIITILHVDAPANQIIVRRCNTFRVVATGYTYDEASPEYKRFMDLVDHLTTIVSGMPWKTQPNAANSTVSIHDVYQHFLP